MRNVNFASAVGTLMHIAVQTRPDIAKAVQNVAQYMSNPNRSHWNAIKRIFQYLKATRGYVLTVGGDGPTEPVAWCDACYGEACSGRLSCRLRILWFVVHGSRFRVDAHQRGVVEVSGMKSSGERKTTKGFNG